MIGDLIQYNGEILRLYEFSRMTFMKMSALPIITQLEKKDIPLKVELKDGMTS